MTNYGCVHGVGLKGPICLQGVYIFYETTVFWLNSER